MPRSVVFFDNKNFPNVKYTPSFNKEKSFPHKHGVALHTTDDVYFAMGVNEGGTVHHEQRPGASFEGLKDWVANSFGDNEPTESDYVPGTVYKRIHRPLASSGSLFSTISQAKLTESFVALRILLNKLEELFETVEPTAANLSTYGHKIREIILLGCMEVESSWSAVLKENEYSSSPTWTTKDYVKLYAPMLLNCYTLALQSYPGLPRFTPFEDWDAAKPTQSLPWYDAYNETKHDREGNLHFATLHNAVQSVGAAVVMFHSQFGFALGPTGKDLKSPIIENIFRLETDFEKHWRDCYIPKFAIVNNEPKPLPDWVATNYPF